MPLACGLAGAAVILSFELRANSLEFGAGVGVLLGLMSGVFYATVVVSMRRLRGHSVPFSWR